MLTFSTVIACYCWVSCTEMQVNSRSWGQRIKKEISNDFRIQMNVSTAFWQKIASVSHQLQLRKCYSWWRRVQLALCREIFQNKHLNGLICRSKHHAQWNSRIQCTTIRRRWHLCTLTSGFACKWPIEEMLIEVTWKPLITWTMSSTVFRASHPTNQQNYFSVIVYKGAYEQMGLMRLS